MQPATLDAAILEKLISAAVAAPSIHNTQPWRYRLDPDTTTLEVRADPRRGLRYTDPAGRALHLSVGASVFNLRVAVAHFGWAPVVRLLPRPGEPELLASVRLAGLARAPGNGHRGDLYDAIWRRHTSRLPFMGHRPPAEAMAELIEAAHQEGAALRFPDNEAEVQRLMRLTAEGERRNAGDPDKRAESRRWLLGPGGGESGLPGAALGPQDATGRIPMRDFTGLRPADRLPSAVFESHPTIGVLSTVHDRRADWLRAGQALEHVLLLVTAQGLRASMLHQAVEWPDLRWALGDGHHEPAHVHLLLRVGHGPAGAATPRRGARRVLDSGPFGAPGS